MVGVSSPDNGNVEAYIERRKASYERYDRFCREFEVNHNFGSILTTVKNSDGLLEKIEIQVYPDDLKIETTDLDHEEPVRFAHTKSKLAFRRHRPPPKETAPEEIHFDFSFLDDEPTVEEMDAKADEDHGGNEGKILEDLQNKFADLGLSDIPILPYARRLLRSTEYVDRRTNSQKIDMIMPLYRSLEIKRLLADPTSPESGYLTISTQRQHVYNQLMSLFYEIGMDASQITEHMMLGVFDSNVLAGVPVFTDEQDNHYVVIDCAFGGYDERKPSGTDFEGKIINRSQSEILHILQKAEEQGYETYFCGNGVSGGIHQHWHWHGIKINEFDAKHLENNVPKILKLLHDVGIDPQEAAATVDPTDVSQLYIR